MSIIRVVKQRGRYLVADAEIFEDKSLSFGARGLMAYLLTKPDNWEVRRDHLIAASPAGRVALQGMINELKKAGYIYRRQENDPATGKFITVTMVFERKSLNVLPNLQVSDQELPGIPPTYGGEDVTVTTKPAHGDTVDRFSVDGKPVHIANNDLSNIHNGSFRHLEIEPPGGYIGPPAQAVNAMISTLSGTCKGFANFLLGDQCPFYTTAYTLLENGITEDQVFAFREWWKKNGYYDGKPALATLMAEIENAISGVKIEPKKSAGRVPPIVQHAIEDLDLWVRGSIGVDEFRSAHTLTAVRQVGEPALKGLNQYNRKALIGQFVSEFERARKGEKIT